MKTAARQGFPVWEVGELVTIKGVVFFIAVINPEGKELVLRYHSKAKGIGAMMDRLRR